MSGAVSYARSATIRAVGPSTAVTRCIEWRPLGEGFAGTGDDAAHVNTVLGDRSGPVGTAWPRALRRFGEAAATSEDPENKFYP